MVIMRWLPFRSSRKSKVPAGMNVIPDGTPPVPEEEVEVLDPFDPLVALVVLGDEALDDGAPPAPPLPCAGTPEVIPKMASQPESAATITRNQPTPRQRMLDRKGRGTRPSS